MYKLITIPALSLLLCGCWNTGNGSKVGNIVAIKDSGMLVRTYTIEVIKGGMSNGSGSFSGKAFFANVEDALQINNARTAFNNQEEVIVKYHTELYCAPWRREGEANYCVFVDSVTSVNENP